MRYQTRSKTQQLQRDEAALQMEEAARILVELSQADDLPPSPKLQRSLSHQDEAYARAIKLAPHTKHGDTILMNFYIDSYLDTIVSYMKNENGTMVVHTIHAPYHTIDIKWTYEVTEFPFY